MPETLDLTPSWADVGNIVKRFALSKETKALEAYWSEVAKAFALAQALTELRPTLTDEQKAIMSKSLAQALGRQGY